MPGDAGGNSTVGVRTDGLVKAVRNRLVVQVPAESLNVAPISMVPPLLRQDEPYLAIVVSVCWAQNLLITIKSAGRMCAHQACCLISPKNMLHSGKVEEP